MQERKLPAKRARMRLAEPPRHTLTRTQRKKGKKLTDDSRNHKDERIHSGSSCLAKPRLTLERSPDGDVRVCVCACVAVSVSPKKVHKSQSNYKFIHHLRKQTIRYPLVLWRVVSASSARPVRGSSPLQTLSLFQNAQKAAENHYYI